MRLVDIRNLAGAAYLEGLRKRLGDDIARHSALQHLPTCLVVASPWEQCACGAEQFNFARETARNQRRIAA